jgi:hypothetical protein
MDRVYVPKKVFTQSNDQNRKERTPQALQKVDERTNTKRNEQSAKKDEECTSAK